MKIIDFNAADLEQHVCKSYRTGEWIIFYCEECPDYERRMNWRTGEMNVKNGKAKIRHNGYYTPGEYKDSFENIN